MNDLDVSQLVELRIHKVSASLLNQFREILGEDISLDDVVEFKIHRISPELAQQYYDLGFEDLNRDNLIECAIQRVRPEYIQEMRSTGMDFSIEELVECRIHHVTADFIRTFQIDELEGIELKDILAAKIHKMTPEFVVEYRQAGIPMWRPRNIGGYYHFHVPADYVKGMLAAGIEDSNEIIKAFKAGVKVEEVQAVLKNGSDEK